MIPFKLIQFKYRNWRGQEHTYLVLPTTLRYSLNPMPQESPLEQEWHWYLNAEVIQRDGEDRSGARSFIIQNMQDVEEVAR